MMFIKSHMTFEKSHHQSQIQASDAQAAQLFTQGQYQQALNQNQVTVNLIGHNTAETHLNFAACYSRIFEPELAAHHFSQYMKLSHSQTVWDIRRLSDYHAQANQIDQAFDIVCNQQHDCAEKHLDLSWHLFRQHRYEQAFREMDHGKRQGNILWIGQERWDNLPQCDRWQDQDLLGKRVCIVGECGLGDEFIFARWIATLLKKHPTTQFYYYTNNTISHVIMRNFDVAPHQADNQYHFWIPSMSLPLMAQHYDPTVTQAYIKPDPVYVKKWKSLLGNQRVISLSWTGSTQYSENHFRDIPVEYLVEKLKDRYTLVSVCMEALTCPDGVWDLTPQIKTWEDTLAILSLSEIVLCSCSSVSHAAGSLGVKTFVYTRPDDYFTWGGTLSGEKTVWYPDVTVWRKSRMGQWQLPINQSLLQWKKIAISPKWPYN